MNNLFQWDDKAEKCFETLNKIMSIIIVLTTPYFSKPFVIECDAPSLRIGVVLMQDEHPIEFERRKLNKIECLKSTYNKEILSILCALAKEWQYLLGSKFLYE